MVVAHPAVIKIDTEFRSPSRGEGAKTVYERIRISRDLFNFNAAVLLPFGKAT